MANIQVNQIKYLGEEALNALWEKISATYLRQANTEEALTTFGDSNIIKTEDKTFIQKGTFDELERVLTERMDDIEAAQGTNIDNNTIINKDGLLQTDLLLSNDKDNHILSIVTGKGNTVSTWDYTEFYQEAVKDGILESVSLIVIPGDENAVEGREEGTYLKFVFNTAAGQDPIYVNVTDLIDIYTGSTYIDVTNGVISIKQTEFVEYLKTENALNITGIVSRIETNEENIAKLQEAVANLNLEEILEKLAKLDERITDTETTVGEIVTYLQNVPNTPITSDEIWALE
jgi:hypothetical protein